MLKAFIHHHQLNDSFYQNGMDYFIPLAKHIQEQQHAIQAPYFVAVNGCQGSGKSTMALFLQQYLSDTFHKKVIVMSLDDFYLSAVQRQRLAAKIHPLFATRGVPGTHDMAQLQHVLKALKSQKNTYIPQFNKTSDNPYPQNIWQHITCSFDIVIFEGWCWGVAAQTSEQLVHPVNELEAEHDPKAIWRKHVNLQLAQYYQPLQRQEVRRFQNPHRLE